MTLAVRCVNPDRLTTLALPEILDISATEMFLGQLDALVDCEAERLNIDFRDVLYVDHAGLNLLKMARRQFGASCQLGAINLNARVRQSLSALSAGQVISLN